LEEDSGGAAIFSYETRQAALATQIKLNRALEACCRALSLFFFFDMLFGIGLIE